MADERPTLRVTAGLRIPESELRWRFSRSGGPGGQHANTSESRVDVSFDIANSPSLGPRQRARLLEKIGPVARVAASDERSQMRNREIALDRMRATGEAHSGDLVLAVGFGAGLTYAAQVFVCP